MSMPLGASTKAFNKYRPRDINLEVGIGGRKTGGGGGILQGFGFG